ncbi:MAG: T9SS type A sorting domain-containing protein [Bacteroidota bacterium]
MTSPYLSSVRDFPEANPEQQLEIRNTIGQFVFFKTYNIKGFFRENIVVKEWSGGIYIVKFKKGNTIKTSKIVIEH